MVKKKAKECSAQTIWGKYQKSLDYMRLKNIKAKTDKNWNFYIGKQWEGINVKDGSNKDELPQMNIIKPVGKYKVSVISKRKMIARYTNLKKYTDEDMQARNDIICSKLSTLFADAWQKSKMDSIVWKMLKSSFIQGDSYVYFGDEDINKKPTVLPNTSVLLGDENVTDLQTQPYIILRQRLGVDKVKEIAKANGISKEKYETITGDSDTIEEIVNTKEVNDKVTSLVYMQKIDGIVNVARTTQNVMYEEFHPIQQTKGGEYTGVGQKLYPIISMIWEERPNTARGISEVEQMIPNQLEINKTLVRRAMAIKISSYPRLAYDLTSISDESQLDVVGGKIGVNGGDARSINQSVAYLQPMGLTGDPKVFTDELMANTRELAGAGDFATGNINPERTSGAAIVAIREQAQLPLSEQETMLEQFVIDKALIDYDRIVAFNVGEIPIDNVMVPVADLAEIEPDIKIDVSDDGAWSKALEQQNLDSLLERQYITFQEYIDLIPESANLPKTRILAKLEERANNGSQGQVEGQEIDPEQLGEEINPEQINPEQFGQEIDQGQIDQI